MKEKILQDADRLDAIGAIGIARVFSVSGAKNRQFYEPNDPFLKNRKADDGKWALDHFFKKLFLLEHMMNTKTGKIEAKKRTSVLKNYLTSLKKRDLAIINISLISFSISLFSPDLICRISFFNRSSMYALISFNDSSVSK